MPVYKDKERGTWYYQINYTDINGEYKQKRKSGFATRAEAKNAEYLATIELDHSSATELTFKELAHHYFDFIEKRVKESSYITKVNAINLHIMPFFEKMKVRSITSKDIIAWQKEMNSKDFSHEYLSKIYNNLSAILNHAKHYGIADNPCKLVGNFKKVETIKEEVNFWTLPEFNQFIMKVIEDNIYYTFFLFLYYMGTRKGEAMALKWKDINLKTGIADIHKTVTEKTTEGGWKVTSPKNVQSNRKILMPKALQKQMIDYYNYCSDFENFNDNCFVFGVSRPLASTTITRKFDEYIKQANVKRIKVHDLRHSHASLLINHGANILIVSQRLGHKDVNETLNTYSHMFPNKEKEVVELIDNL